MRLDLTDDFYSLHFHPLVSVLGPLPANHQQRLEATLRHLAYGSVAGLSGMLQHEGLLVELAEVPTSVASWPSTGLDPVLVFERAAQPPSIRALQAEIAGLERRVEIDMVSVEEVRADLDPTASARLAELTVRLASDEASRPERDQELASEIEAAEYRLGCHDRAMGRIDRTEEVLDDSRRRLDDLRRQLGDELDRSAPVGTDLLLDRLTTVVDRSVGTAGCAIPVLLRGDFSTVGDDAMVELMDELDVLAGRVQIILVTSHPAAARWASDVGLERASTVRTPRPVL